ncbi:hypothetical protein CFP56_007042 [Quercus suber]|uniref:Uncharacterized protein n=1 Tax=Quercus suber TaxID=58331 RepID=A0AAW0L673_QUESU
MCLVEHTTCPAGCVNTNPCAEVAALGRYYDMSVAGHKLVLSLGQTGQTKPIGIISVDSVKSYWLNSDGADVVFHMIDNFLL